jgi:hypothetical protein
MYYKNYDPNIHDIYLYGPGNTGYPIGINPTSLIAGASADFASVSPRYRNFTGNATTHPIPPNAGVTSLPNYYNLSGSPLYVVFGDKTLGSNIHYTANKTSDSVDKITLAKYTGTTTAYPALSVALWNKNLSGFCYFGPFTGFYNCVPLNQVSGNTSYMPTVYFGGSPEIPGFGLGATFYQVLPQDNGIMDLVGAGLGITMHQPIAKKIHFSTYIKEIIDQGITPTIKRGPIVTNNGTILQGAFTIIVPGIDLYIWDGNDKIIPIPELEVFYSYLEVNNIKSLDPYVFYLRFLNGVAYDPFAFTPVPDPDYDFWVGDSSSQVIYKKNNSLFFLGSVYGVGAVFDPSINFIVTALVSGSFYCSESIPLYTFLKNSFIDENNYWYPLNQGLTLSTQIDFNRIETYINNLNSSVNFKYQEWNNNI